MTSDLYDVAVVGAGPAGSSAAIYLAQSERRVALIERDKHPRDGASASWLNARAAPLLDELGVPIKSLLKCVFRDVTFHSADFTKVTKPRFDEAPGYLIDRAQFDNALYATADKAGVALLAGTTVSEVRLNESSVDLLLEGGEQLSSRLLILSSGRGSALLESVGFSRRAGETPIWTAQVDAPVKGAAAGSEPRINVILGLDKLGSFGMCCVSKTGQAISINWFGERTAALPAFSTLCKAAHEHDVAPVDVSEQARSAELVRSPAAAALDMDSHVGKHTLLIGDAGGFVAAASNEGIYPAMWSARIAVDVINKALESVHSQDELMTFDSVWRIEMADYLRSPNTDSQFLIPLIFSNQPMADRMGAAFFSGENI